MTPGQARLPRCRGRPGNLRCLDVAGGRPTLDAKLAMADVVLGGVDGANRRHHGSLEAKQEHCLRATWASH
jgi:hypothetical protein